MDARPPILRAKCYPLRLDTVTDSHICEWLGELVKVDLVILYSVDGRPYLQMRTWERHQQMRAKYSKYPDIPSSAINCNQVIANVPDNDNENPIRESNTKDVVVVAPTPPAKPINGTEQSSTVYACWQDNMRGTLSSVIAEDIGDLIDTYGADSVIRAIGEAARSEARNIRYVTGILKNWAAGKQKPLPPTANGRASPNGRGTSRVDKSMQAFDDFEAMAKAKGIHL
jgi:DnaD/phage-associated family protein